MVMELERLVDGPYSKRPELPIASDHETAVIIQQKIRSVAKAVLQPFRARAHYPITLLTLTNQEFSTTTAIGFQHESYRIPRELGQRTVMELMKNWGLNEVNYSENDEPDPLTKGVRVETRKYPSNLKGMHFERTREYYAGEKGDFEVKWKVVPEVAMFKFNPVDVLLRKGRVQKLPVKI